MQSTHFAPVDGLGQQIDWARLLAILQNPHNLPDGSRTFRQQRYGDVEEGGIADGSPTTSASGSSPVGSISPRDQNRPMTSLHVHTAANEPPVRQQGPHGGGTEPAWQASTAAAPFLGSISQRAPGAGPSGPTALGFPDAASLEDPAATSVSAAAERHRLISETSGVNLPVLAEWLADLVPFLLLLAWVFVLKHLGTLLLLLLLAGCTLRANADIRRLIALRREARLAACLTRALSVAAVAAAAVATTLPGGDLVGVLTLRGAPTESAIDALLLVLLADTVVRYGSLAPKLLVVAWFRGTQHKAAGSAVSAVAGGPGASSATAEAAAALCGSGSGCAVVVASGFGGFLRRLGLGFGGGGGGGRCPRGGGATGAGGGLHHHSSHLVGAARQRQQSRVLTAVERGVTLYRSALPAPVWYGYLLRGGGFSPVLASLLCGFYLALKASYLVIQARLLVLAVRTATRQSALYGTYVGRGNRPDLDIGTLGTCPVCQDPVATPVRLDCGHIFCEECILEWLERDRTCPMCRAPVRPAGLPSCSDGASPMLPQVF